MAGIDENPYKAPEDQGAKLPAKKSAFLDPVANVTQLLGVLAVLAVALIAAMIKSGRF